MEKSNKPLRCSTKKCKRKLKLMDTIMNKCHCGGTFCKKHKLNHDCNHDAFKAHRELLKKNNPKVEFAKISERV